MFHHSQERIFKQAPANPPKNIETFSENLYKRFYFLYKKLSRHAEVSQKDADDSFSTCRRKCIQKPKRIVTCTASWQIMPSPADTCTLIRKKPLSAAYSLRKELFLFICKVVYQLFSGRSLRTVTAVCHISLSRN